MALERCRKQQKSIKLGHSSFYRLPRSRCFNIRNRQQDTFDPLISRRKRNAETRDHGRVARVSRIALNPARSDHERVTLGTPLRTDPRVSLTQGRASLHFACTKD